MPFKPHFLWTTSALIASQQASLPLCPQEHFYLNWRRCWLPDYLDWGFLTKWYWFWIFQFKVKRSYECLLCSQKISNASNAGRPKVSKINDCKQNSPQKLIVPDISPGPQDISWPKNLWYVWLTRRCDGVGISITWKAFVGVTAQLKSQSQISLFTLMIYLGIQ